MLRGAVLVLVSAVAIAACSSNSPASPFGNGGVGGSTTVTGNERLGWTQQAANTTELASIHFAIYVDGTRSVLSGATCSGPPSSDGYSCSGPLPSMSRGAHTLELASFTDIGGVLESDKSAPISIVVSGTSSTSTAESESSGSAVPFPAGTVISTADGTRLTLDLVADGLDTPTAMAFASDGRIFVAERAGRVRIVRDGALLAQPALAMDDVVTTNELGLLGLATDPGFDQNHFLYAVFTSAGTAGPVFTVARFREASDTLADRVVLLTEVQASSARAAAALGFGPDGKLYVALDNAGSAKLVDDLASPNGKILRLNSDGTTPADQAAASPTFSFPYQSPRGLGWQPASGLLWVADSNSPTSTRLVAVARPKTAQQRSTIAGVQNVDTQGSASALAVYAGRLIPSFAGNVLIGANEARDILRVRLDAQNPAQVVGVDRLLNGAAGNVRAVSVGPDGAIYFAVTNAIGRLRPVG